MSDGINHEFDKYIDPILSDESIWRNSNNFRQARKELYCSLRREGYSDEYINNEVIVELFKRWEPLYIERLNSIVEG